MNIVDWDNTDLKPKTDDETRKQIFKTLLSQEIETRWSGKIVDREKKYDAVKAPRVEIRKSLGEAAVLIVVGVKAGAHSFGRSQVHVGEVVTVMSMNGKATLSDDDLIELNLAQAEAKGMYEAYIESL